MEQQIENQQERPEDHYARNHALIKGLLGDTYNQEKIDAIVAGNMDIDKIVEEVKNIPSSTNPVSRRKNISAWYKSHQEELDMFGK